ncbi:MAG: N-acetylmuramoyl-L-alanine amidase [bacterium]|jgi:N-acetylmuramoyl-L-alanine amidase
MMAFYRRAFLWCLFLWLICTSIIPAQAAASSIGLIINGQAVVSDVPPVIHNNRTMVPLRVISEGLGAQVSWDNATRSVRVALPDGEITLGIGKNTAFVRNEEHNLDAPPIIIGDRTMVPLRFLGEALGAQVHWDDVKRTVTVMAKSAELRNVVLRSELGREVLSLTGVGQIKGTVTQSGNQVIITMPETKLATPVGMQPVSGMLVQAVSVHPLIPGQDKGVVVTVDLQDPTPFTVTAGMGELNLVLPYRLEKLSYEQRAGGEVLTMTTTGQVPYRVQQLGSPDRLVINLSGIVAGPKLTEPVVKSLLNKGVTIEHSPTGINLVVDQSIVTKFRVTASPSGIELFFAPQITGYSYQAIPGGARIKIQATGAVNYRTTKLQQPDRLVLDFDDTILSTTQPPLDINDEVVKQVRAGQFAVDPDVTRLVVELQSYLSHQILPGDNPGELIVELTSSPILGRYIGIDAGHGGSEPGAVSPSGLKEKDLNLDIAKRVAAGLKAAGARVYMLRPGDNTIDFRDRPEMANKENVEVLISIHCNSLADPTKRGTETYYFKDGYGGQALAQAVQEAMVSLVGLPDRGTRTADYNVIRYTKMPAALVEVAYLSNPVEEKLLADAAFREKAAQAIVTGIMNYFRTR